MGREIDDRLKELGIELPPPPQPVASYVPVVATGHLAYVAAQIPLVDGEMMHPGKVGAEVSVEQAQEAARRCALQALSALRDGLEGFDRLKRIVRLDVFVASAPGFTDQPKVANGASDVLREVMGEAGKHARAELLRMKSEEPWRSFHVRSEGEEPLGARLSEALRERMKAELPCHWQQLRAVEMVLDEVAEEFGGEDVLKPTLRQEIAAAKEKALAVQVTLQEWTGAFELPEPDPEALKETRRLIKRAAET